MEYQASIRLANMPDVPAKLFIGENQSHFMVWYIGWQGIRYLHHCLFNIEIIEDKVWLHEDATDMCMADKLIEIGILKHRILCWVLKLFMLVKSKGLQQGDF